MIEFTKDLIHRAWLVEDINGENTLVEVEYQNYDGTTEKIFAGIRRNGKLINGEYEWFEIKTTHPCIIDGEKAYYSDTEESFAGSVFNLAEDGTYVSQDGYGTGIASIVDKNARFYVSHMLYKTQFRSISKTVTNDPEFSGLSDFGKRGKINELRQEIRIKVFPEFMKKKRKNRIRQQKKWDKEMASIFPEWIPEYNPIS